MYAPEEIIAMKVQAILGRGKKKDFWDVAELLQHYHQLKILSIS
jgi:predicted nucleotidyltransferase component of viral defense system